MLAFYAKPGHSCYPPGVKFVGQVNQYIGQSWTKLPDGSVALIHDTSPVLLDPASPEGLRAAKHCRQGGLWPADRKTAQACGVPFVAVEHDGEQWVPAKPRAQKPPGKDS